jgi:hypothetical protein
MVAGGLLRTVFETFVVVFAGEIESRFSYFALADIICILNIVLALANGCFVKFCT